MSLIEYIQESEYGAWLLTFLISILPIVELRGAIPVGVSMGLSPSLSMVLSILGNMLPVPFIILFIRRIFEWMQAKSTRLKRAVDSLVKRAEGKWDKVHKYELLGLVILVAIPLPGTGAWTGALIAALMDIRMKDAIPAIFVGVIIAGILVTGITHGFTVFF